MVFKKYKGTPESKPVKQLVKLTPSQMVPKFTGGADLNPALPTTTTTTTTSSTTSTTTSTTTTSAPAWVEYFDNTYWTAVAGSWDGSEWDDDGIIGTLNLEESGTWNEGFRPTHIRITHNHGAGLAWDVLDKDTPANSILDGTPNCVSGQSYSLTFVGFDIDNLDFIGIAPGWSITNIEFLGG